MSLSARSEPVELDWSFPESNRAQDYASHNVFRYFGKLPPLVTKKILGFLSDSCPAGPVVDVMCGSGTTLVEARLAGLDSIGIDCNPLSVLVSRVKTRRIDGLATWSSFERLSSLFNSHRSAEEAILPPIRNIDYWFNEEAQRDLSNLRLKILDIEDEVLKDFFLVCFAAIVRRASDASASAGRIFKDTDKTPQPVWLLFEKHVRHALPRVLDFGRCATPVQSDVQQGDARKTDLAADSASSVICHPPYFALYKYSSDVLRFELDWLFFDRKSIGRSEIADGFKTTDIRVYKDYIDDLRKTFLEARRILVNDGVFCLINNNSTLGDERLPVIRDLEDIADSLGLVKIAGCNRDVRFAQALYHKSARDDKQTARDQIVFFRKM